MSELKLKLKLKYKNKKTKKVKEELKEIKPLNLIDVYMVMSLNIFPNKNIKIKNIKEG
ncbi:unnamed protein product [marine sediment metagenome]|uniref:Uncharacterized protein n=1 Tax=marine sediment metagenome TaxID=412755 RepID=X1JBS5_9ZZZZ